MLTYKDKINFNYKFKRSINIRLSDSNCETYRLTNISKKLLQSLLKKDYNTNSFAIIGPFGTGKSAFLLFLDSLLNKDKICEKKIGLNPEFKKYYDDFFKIDTKVFVLKFTGEYSSFKEFFKNSIIENYKELKETIDYLKEDNYTIEGLLSILNNEILKKGYDKIFFFIDEFGKLLSYGLNVGNKNDVTDLQVLSEYANNSNHTKLLITLHRNIKDYANNIMSLNYNEWKKIQGRFETILFEYNFYELISIVSNSFSLNKKIKDDLNERYKKFNIEKDYLNNFLPLFPLHHYTIIAVSQIFTKYFQNNRSIYSFLFSNEPYSFNEFLKKEFNSYDFYYLSDLYDYIFYLSKAYEVQIPNEEIWHLSSDYIKKYKFSNLELKILKIISLIQAYKIDKTIPATLENIKLSLLDSYTDNEISISINNLEEKNIIILTPYKEYSLINAGNIDLYSELKIEKQGINNFDYFKIINEMLTEDIILAKRFFIIKSNQKYFTKLITDNLLNLKKYTITFVVDKEKSDLFEVSRNNSNIILLNVSNINELSEHLKEIEALKIIKKKNYSILTSKTHSIIDNQIKEKSNFIKEHFKFNSNINFYYNGEIFPFTSKEVQKIISKIFEIQFPDMPIINNYTLTHITRMGRITPILKKLFTGLLKNSDKEFLGIKKYPAEKAIYLSVIKPSMIHIKESDNWKLETPTKLNFINVWNFIKKTLNRKISVTKLVKLLENEPYGLEKEISLFLLTIFIIIHKNEILIFRENTYKYSLNENLLINLLKMPQKFELKYLVLEEYEISLFNTYLKIIDYNESDEFERESVKNIINKIYGNFEKLPEYNKNTKKLSNKAIALRKALFISRTPYEGLFKKIPFALGYKDIKNIDLSIYLNEFKNTFNEIVVSYKNTILELSKYISSCFNLEVKHYPYNNEIIEISKGMDYSLISSDLKSFISVFANTNSLRDFINGISIFLNEKKIDDSYDLDVENLKLKIKNISKELFSSIELSKNLNDEKEIRKLSLSLLESNFAKIIKINKNKYPELKEYALKLRKNLPNNLNRDEKLFILTEIIKEEYENE